jgi:CheY-like chemotaxis protein
MAVKMQTFLRPLRILLVEDNRGDALLFKRAFSGTGLSHHITVASTGESALRMVQGAHDESQPDLIVLDLNLPGINGHQVLNILKNHKEHRCIPVFILSSSRAPLDVLEGYNAHANSYIVKPYNSDELKHVADCIGMFCHTLTPVQKGDIANGLRASL